MIRTGKDAYVNGISCVSSWSLNRVASVTRYSASCTGKGTGATNGNINVTGTITGIGGDPGIVWGSDVIGAKFVIDGSASGKLSLSGNIRFNELTINIPKEAGTEINWSANFGVQGDVTEDTAVAYTDSTLVEHLGAAVAADSQWSDAGTSSFADIDGFRGARLTIRKPEKTYVVDGVTLRDSGNFEADLAIDVFSDDLLPAKDLNAIGKMKVYINQTEFWEVWYAKIAELTNFQMNRATQDLVGYTINYMWSNVYGTGNPVGKLVRPNLTDLLA